MPSTSTKPRRNPSFAAIGGLLVVAAGLFAGLGPLDDNSFLTHLATGRLIVERGSIPHHDPYTFTALGHAWVVQSWLVSLIYGLADRAAGAGGVLFVVSGTAAAVAFLIWLLTRPATTLVPRMFIAAVVVGVGVDFWLERPLLFGLAALGLALLAAEGRLDPRWLVPTFWVWVNVHGSFPLGLAALVALLVGRRLDREDASAEGGAVRWAVVGTLVGAVNPLGPRMLLFPFELLARQDVLQHVVEWQAPDFRGVSERVFLMEVAVAILALVRRPSWRAGVPLVLFTSAALIGSRNVVVASVVLVPGLAVGLGGLGSITGLERRPAFRVLAIGLPVLMALGMLSRLGDPYPPDGYPVDAVAWLEDHDLTDRGSRLVTQDFVGNFLESRLGARGIVFMDDRYDMFPTQVIDDYFVILRGRPGWDDVLDRYEPDAVLWQEEQPLAQLLRASSDWEVVYDEDGWLIAQPA